MPHHTPEPQNDTVALQRELDILGRLLEIGRVMNSTTRLEPLLDYIMHTAEEITGSEAASILLVDPNTGDLRFTAATGHARDELIGMVVPLKGSIAGTIVAEDRALIVSDVTRDPRHYRGVDEEVAFQTRSILGVPMRIKDRLVGVLEVLNKTEGEYQDEDLLNIAILASSAAVAIENAQLIRSLEEANDALDRLSKLKSDFIAIASHELRTPRGIILGYAAGLQEEAQPPADAYTDALFKAALKMRTLVEGMTNLRYIQLDEGETHLEPVPVGEIMRAAYDEVLEFAGTKDQIYLCEEAPPDLFVLADRAKAVLALSNVVDNAVKFTPSGGAVIVSVEQRSREAWITVRDNGYGIPEGEAERIFAPFYQVEDPLTRRYGGLGIGLTITRAVMERHNGRVWAESPGPGEGARVTLAFPLAGGWPDA
ncbi:MAG: GAF domain-containing sensor histidine kinase [Chloroflexi bacterium]|nr:GAF domain-containing sensor histidine kinase [Chloroflexota bacterium]